MTAITAPASARVDRFLSRVSGGGSTRARLIFAIDATASREATWDRAIATQSEMFLETASIGGLEVQLVYYRGIGECRASKWVSTPAALVKLMTGVMCRGGLTQLGKVLAHAIKETTRRKVAALVFVGDAFEEQPDEVLKLADELGRAGVKVFLFREGDDPEAKFVFSNIAKATGGAHLPLDSSSPRQLRVLLGAVAAYAAGGQQALGDYARREPEARRLTHQLGGKP